ncbi:NAD(P)H-dependent oxidoreductase [Pseudothauera nasutitermitis]|uniref:NAD(P)H-dependent oxidoreductase n=1 Tax=Pseudothauera nasutitermitis TaxID=2565930 RepID=A0A4S4AXW4_9RHOO|nr:NAD(P)H-dependent oxidoreductase [Pseudothauera nasutitermitis]THF64924.1 NAD(P)H-dependent oxidoreductase [Pseudothauera nasutitermitis]
MKVFIVHAHPEPQSFCTAMKSAAVEIFERQGHEVQVSDLYAMGFQPVASTADFGDRADPDYCVYALEQRHGVDTGTLGADIRAELDKLLWCELLVLVFPLFWFSTPAMLKGWIDRVFVSGRVYGGKRFYDRGGLVGRRALVGLTLGGQEHMFGPQGIHGPLEGMLKHLLQGTLAYAGLQVLPPFVGWHVPYITDEARRQLLAAWEHRLRSVQDDTPLRFPSLADYDDRLRPLSVPVA